MGIARTPVIGGMTGAYAGRSNGGHVFACGEVLLGIQAMLNDLELLTGAGSPYTNVNALPMLDHAQPDLDGELLENCTDRFAIVMYDCSHHPLEENTEMTADYVRRHGKEVVIEGAVDELKEATAEGAFDLTTPAQAEQFLEQTDVDLIVCNLGTEHRAAAAGKVQYHGERAREIRDRVGRRMVLHGTSSLGDDDLHALPGDGIMKVNIWTILERKGGQAVARQVIADLGNILNEAAIRELQAEGRLGQRHLSDAYRTEYCGGSLGPKLDAMTVASRRDAWMQTIVPTMKRYYRMFGYENLAD